MVRFSLTAMLFVGLTVAVLLLIFKQLHQDDRSLVFRDHFDLGTGKPWEVFEVPITIRNNRDQAITLQLTSVTNNVFIIKDRTFELEMHEEKKIVVIFRVAEMSGDSDLQVDKIGFKTTDPNHPEITVRITIKRSK